MAAGSDSLRIPTFAIFVPVGTRSVILSFAKLTTTNLSTSSRNCLFLNSHDLADAVGWVYDKVVCLKSKSRLAVRWWLAWISSFGGASQRHMDLIRVIGPGPLAS